MKKRVLLIQGHPDAGHAHLCGALERAYEEGALAAGHEVRHIQVADLNFPLLKSQDEWEHGPLPSGLQAPQADIGWAQHIVFFFPLWLGDMPALLKGFLEQVARPGFAFGANEENKPMPRKGLKGRSARIVVTMGMPSLFYKWYFRAHSIRSMKRNILGFVGIAPVDETLIGMTGKMNPAKAQRWIARLHALGRASA